MPKGIGTVIALGTGLLGLLGVAAAATKAPKVVELPPPPKGLPENITEKVAAALLTQDPDRIEQLAGELDTAGYTKQAAKLRVLAAELRKQQAKKPEVPYKPPVIIPTKPTPAPVPTPVPTPGPMPAPPPTPTPDVAKQQIRVTAAKDLMAHLKGTKRYREDRKKVASFQALMGLKQDRLYGANTAKAAASLNVVPVKPFYWPKNPVEAKAAKTDYRSYLLARGEQDPGRFAQWQEAASV